VADILALEHLFDAVVARFAADGMNVPNTFGWLAPSARGPATRITWAPGDTTGVLGEMRPPTRPGNNPRSIATLGELVTVTIEAKDDTAQADERKQWRAARLLYDAWWLAAYLALPGQLRVRSAAWLRDRKVLVEGAALRVVLEIDAMIPDVAREVAPADAAFAGTVSELDQDDVVNVPAGATP
jgi:hypothetical protein